MESQRQVIWLKFIGGGCIRHVVHYDVIYAGCECIISGKGVSKRSAKQLAAKKLLMNLQISPDEIQNTLKQGQNPSPPSQIATTTEVDLSKVKDINC